MEPFEPDEGSTNADRHAEEAGNENSQDDSGATLREHINRGSSLDTGGERHRVESEEERQQDDVPSADQTQVTQTELPSQAGTGCSYTVADLDLDSEEESGPVNPTLQLSTQDQSLVSSATVLPDESQGSGMGSFGEYELLDILGRGGMGMVYKARQPRLNRIVALKMVIHGQLASEADVQRFQTEAEAVAKLDHPGIVPVYDVGQINGRHYFSMGYVDGTSLARRIAQSPLPPRQAAKLIEKVAEAIHHAHERGILHRDLKPSNVLLDQSGVPKVIDFGLAKRFEEDASLTATGMVVGTPSYMAPERIDERLGEVGVASDVYALGAVLYEALSGRPPFQSSSAVNTMEQVLKAKPVSLRTLVPGLPEDLDAICLHCLKKDPAKRYKSAQDLANDLRRWLDYDPVVAEKSKAPVAAQKKRQFVSALLFLLALLAVAASGWLWLELEKTRTTLAETRTEVGRLSETVDSTRADADATKQSLAAANNSLRDLSQKHSEQFDLWQKQQTEIEKLRADLDLKAKQVTEAISNQNQEQRLAQYRRNIEQIWLSRNPKASLEKWRNIPGGETADRLTTAGIAAYKQGNTDEAKAKFEEAIQASPTYPEAFYFRGYIAFVEERDFDAAIDYLTKTIALDPDDATALALRGEAYLAADKPDSANRDIQRAMELAPSNAHIHLVRGKYLLSEGLATEAIGTFEQAIKVDPDLAEAHYEIAKAYYQQCLAAEDREAEDCNRALQYATKANELTSGERARYVLLVALTRGLVNEYSVAVEQAARAAELNNDPQLQPTYDQAVTSLQNKEVVAFPF